MKVLQLYQSIVQQDAKHLFAYTRSMNEQKYAANPCRVNMTIACDCSAAQESEAIALETLDIMHWLRMLCNCLNSLDSVHGILCLVEVVVRRVQDRGDSCGGRSGVKGRCCAASLAQARQVTNLIETQYRQRVDEHKTCSAALQWIPTASQKPPVHPEQMSGVVKPQ